MPRRAAAQKREIIPDPVYNSKLVAQFVNKVMLGGEKSTAERIVYGALDVIAEKNKDRNPLDVVGVAMENIKPKLEVKSRRVGGANYQVPVEVAPGRQEALALRWIIDFAGGRKGGMMKALAGEIMDAANNTGSAVKKREDMHKMAQANRAFAHYRW